MIQKKYDSTSGEVRYRLRFEKTGCVKPEMKDFGKSDAQAVLRAVQRSGDELAALDNTGVVSVGKAWMYTGSAAAFIHRRPYRLLEKSRRNERRAKKQLTNARVQTAFRKYVRDHPELEKKAFAKWVQKRRIRRRYVKMAHHTAKRRTFVGRTFKAGGKALRTLVQNIAPRKAFFGMAVACLLLLPLFGSMLTSCTAMFSGIQSAILAACYMAQDQEIEQSELKYMELETDLQISVNRTETDFPGYDEYRYHVEEIGHNPYELLGYLSAVYGAFTYGQVEPEICRLFGLQYRLMREEVIEERYFIDDAGIRRAYEWRVLETTLVVQPLSQILQDSLQTGEETGRYEVYMLSCGGRQCFGNPFDTAWIPYVKSPYGYRVDDTGLEKELHQGIDIGMAERTPVRAVQDGYVVSVLSNADVGISVTVENAGGYQSVYQHCSFVSVEVGQEVKRGDVIAEVGSAGDNGAYLHLEVSRNGVYFNPYFYVGNGGDGYLPDGTVPITPGVPGNSGDAMEDDSFAAMLAEAEKYLGFPYVWGGASPATSFDCSGFVSWVVNQSGVGSVGRQTAQGLYNLCTPVSREQMKPGDLVFFTGTYSSANPVTHVGIYVGANRMIHCGDPISYADITSSYWVSKYYGSGRLP